MRLRANFLSGTLTAQLTNAGTVLFSAELVKMPVVTAPNYMPVSLDPYGEFGPPEIAWVTDHASGSTQATLLRHQEGTLARIHNAPTIWANTLTALDFDDLYAQVDSISDELPSYLPLAGGSMLGPLLLEADPIDPLEPATKQYVDQSIGEGDFVPISGGTMTGHISQAAAPTSASHLARKGYVDTKSDADHTHSGYAPTSHTHSYAATSHNHNAVDITAGTLDAARIPGLHADKIIAGELNGARIPNLHTSKITAGVFDPSFIPNLNAAKITGGVFDSARIPNTLVGNVIATGNLTSQAALLGDSLYLAAPLTTTDNGIPGWRHDTTASGSGWVFRRLVSSIRYKRLIEGADLDTLIDQLKAAAEKLISWEEKGTPIGSPRITGISAEDAYEIVPTAVVLDEEGRPDAVDPANAFAVHLIAAVGNLLSRVEALENV